MHVFEPPELPRIKKKEVRKNKVKEIFQNVYQKYQETEIGETRIIYIERDSLERSYICLSDERSTEEMEERQRNDERDHLKGKKE